MRFPILKDNKLPDEFYSDSIARKGDMEAADELAIGDISGLKSTLDNYTTAEAFSDRLKNTLVAGTGIQINGCVVSTSLSSSGKIYEIVQDNLAVTNPSTDLIYLVTGVDDSQPVMQFIYVGGESTDSTSWLHVGNLPITISNYSTTEQMNRAIVSALLAQKNQIDSDISNAIEKLMNNAGQVKVRFTNLTTGTIGFIANTPVTMSIRSAQAVVIDAPTTQWPHIDIQNGTNSYETGFFIKGSDESEDRLRESNCPSQCHRWRISGNYANKDMGNLGVLRCILQNISTGFQVTGSYFIPSGIDTDTFTFEVTSIADNDSLAIGAGYILSFLTSFDDANMIVTVNSIVRISEAVENTEVA